jgi:hypothetical protein
MLLAPLGVVTLRISSMAACFNYQLSTNNYQLTTT